MRRWAFLLLLGVVCSHTLRAQLDLRLAVDRDNFVCHESIHLEVQIISDHANAVILGDVNGWIRFSVLNGRGFPVNQTAKIPKGALFVLGAGKSISKTINLAPFFDFSEPGVYVISASITTRNWRNVRFESQPIKIQVVRGRTMQVLKRGVQGGDGESEPEVVRYSLQSARVNGKAHLFLRVSDDHEPSYRIYSVTPLGMMVNEAKPTMAMDRDGISHVFFQSHKHQYFYCRLNPYGALMRRETYVRERAMPFLNRDKFGRFAVMDGTRVVSESDYPAPLTRAKVSPVITPPTGSGFRD